YAGALPGATRDPFRLPALPADSTVPAYEPAASRVWRVWRRRLVGRSIAVTTSSTTHLRTSMDRVSFYREEFDLDVLGLPTQVRPVGWLCLGRSPARTTAFRAWSRRTAVRAFRRCRVGPGSSCGGWSGRPRRRGR